MILYFDVILWVFLIEFLNTLAMVILWFSLTIKTSLLLLNFLMTFAAVKLFDFVCSFLDQMSFFTVLLSVCKLSKQRSIYQNVGISYQLKIKKVDILYFRFGVIVCPVILINFNLHVQCSHRSATLMLESMEYLFSIMVLTHLKQAKSEVIMSR